MDEKILIVDDEPNVLEGLQRVLRKEFNVVAASGGEAGLTAVMEQGPFAVIVSDMRMPGMDGTQFLRTVLERTPDSVRLALTGNADLQTAIDAVNEGAIFRFSSKPWTEQVLKGALRAAIAQHRLILAERELLEKTLHGSVKVLTEILALVNPAAFSRTSRIHQTVLGIVRELKLPDAWSYEIAAMLSQIGCVALGPETVEAVYGGVELPAVERERFRMHPSIAFEFLKEIPRLETVALMIAAQQDPADYKFPQEDPLEAVAAKLGAEILSVAIDFDQILMTRISRAETIGRRRQRDVHQGVVDGAGRIVADGAISNRGDEKRQASVERDSRATGARRRKGGPGLFADEVPRALNQTLDGVRRVAKILEAMKEFSHPGGDEKAPIDINHAIETTLTVARNEWKYVPELETEFDQSLLLVPCLAGEFNQVILNLVTNAAHAISDKNGSGGRMRGKITIRTRREDEWAEVQIEDTGCGVPERNRSRVFDLFFTTKEVGRGTGQGLALAHTIVVKKHSGQIWFQSEEGKGTTFFVRLPLGGTVRAEELSRARATGEV